METIDLFVKKGVYYSLSSGASGEYGRFNMPMYNKDIKLWKGVDNKIQFSIRDHDRKAYPLRNDTLVMTLINHPLNKKVTKTLWCLDPYKGIYEVTFTKADIIDFTPTYYKASVSKINPEGEEDNLYSGTDWNPIFNVEVIEGLKDVYIPSEDLDPSEFITESYIEEGKTFDMYISKRIDTSLSTVHTAAVTVTDSFVGKIYMEGSIVMNPQYDSDWSVLSQIEFTEEDWDEQTTDLSFLMNETETKCLWVRFRIVTDRTLQQGEVQAITFRN